MSKLYPCVYCTEDGYCKKFSDEEVVSWCVLGPCKDEKPSNGDRFRAKTDEELAEAIYKIFCHDEEGSYCPPDEMSCKKYGFSCRDCWLDWLKQEVDDV